MVSLDWLSRGFRTWAPELSRCLQFRDLLVALCMSGSSSEINQRSCLVTVNVCRCRVALELCPDWWRSVHIGSFMTAALIEQHECDDDFYPHYKPASSAIQIGQRKTVAGFKKVARHFGQLHFMWKREAASNGQRWMQGLLWACLCSRWHAGHSVRLGYLGPTGQALF